MQARLGWTPFNSRCITLTRLSSTGNHRGPISSRNILTASADRPRGPESSAAFATENKRSIPQCIASMNRFLREESPSAKSPMAQLSRYTAGPLTLELRTKSGPSAFAVARIMQKVLHTLLHNRNPLQPNNPLHYAESTQIHCPC